MPEILNPFANTAMQFLAVFRMDQKEVGIGRYQEITVNFLLNSPHNSLGILILISVPWGLMFLALILPPQ